MNSEFHKMFRIHGLAEELFFSSTLLYGVGWLVGWSVGQWVSQTSLSPRAAKSDFGQQWKNILDPTARADQLKNLYTGSERTNPQLQNDLDLVWKG